ncbi:sulfotransferase 1C2-like protein [Leptotrombidium deliense]|uniref:Sulfotransferase 1C2-like protein n=1 Tax=Leptotrombidium deliense TaxID=299467 RepID=A0A443S110_9ACAR|nr:sulfotransferase 1C2-like protein [Leptotrombidium deliense]
MLTQMPKHTEFTGPFDDFFNEFIAGRTDCGSYFDHVVSWYKQSDKKNILFLTFEETKRNTKETILKVAKFLGDSYFNDLNTNEQQMQKLLEYTSFDYMKKLPFVVPKSADVARKSGFNVGKNIDLVNTGDYINIQFFKAGKTSYTKENYSEQQKAIMKQMIQDHFAQLPDLVSIWKQFNVDM